MEAGVSYDKQRLHNVKYFRELLTTNQDIDESIRPLLKLSRRRSFGCRKRNTLHAFIPWPCREMGISSHRPARR
jgi:hypothetical protein